MNFSSALRIACFVLSIGSLTSVFPGLAEAQSTGGSFGGGSFGGGSFGGGGGGSSFGGGGSYHGSGGSSYHGSGGSLGGSGRALLFLLMLGFAVQLAKGLKVAGVFGSASRSPSAGSRHWNRADVTTIQLALDWRARAKVQAKLKRLAARGTSSNRALAKLTRETAMLLLRNELSWLYANVKNYQPASPPEAERRFRGDASDARTRFQTEVIRNVDGSMDSENASGLRARSEEGEGVVVVTFVVAARGELLDLPSSANAAAIETLLRDVSALPESRFVALEVIWSPTEENDRMSTAELEAVYPELHKIDESSIAGRIFCGFCKAPFAAERMSCPHCGAPVGQTPTAPR